MSPDDPRHGTRAGYLAHRNDGETPCDPCQRAHSRKCKEYRVKTGNGASVIRLPVADAEALLAEAERRGITRYALCIHAGLGTSWATRLRERRTVSPRSLERLRAALDDPELTAGCVPSDLTRKRIQALAAQGWSLSQLDEMTGCAISAGKWRKLPTVTRRLAAAVRDVVAEVGDRRGPSVHAARQARAKGWEVLAAWDDPGTLAWPDEPEDDEEPDLGEFYDEAVVLRILSGERLPSTKAERIEIVRRWQAMGRSLGSIERLTGWNAMRYVQREEGAA